MSDWSIIDVIDDHASADGPRLLVVYSAPPEYAPSGVFSSSFPKDHFNQHAAAFGYDLDDENDLQDLFDHVVHRGYMKAVMLKRGEPDGLHVNPYKAGKAAAKRQVRERLEAFRGEGLPKQAGAAERTNGGARTASPDLVGRLRMEMDAVLDRERVAIVDMILDPAVDSQQVAIEMKRRGPS